MPVFLFLFLILIPCAPAIKAAHAPSADELLNALPLRFEQNQGQWDASIRFRAPFSQYNLMLTARGAVLHSQEATLRIQCLDGNAQPVIQATNPLESRSNYFLGGRRSWKSGVKHFARVGYAGVYPGIDLVYYGRGQQLEYDFLIAPGSDPRTIRMKFAGAENMRIGKDGSLLFRAGSTEMVQPRPFAYQGDSPADGTAVQANYRLLAKDEVAFDVAQYDHRRRLVIDPLLTFSTYLGGEGNDVATGLALDPSGDIFVVGYTNSGGIPILDGSYRETLSGTKDIFIARLRPSRSGSPSLIYASYFGGSADEEPAKVYIEGGFLYMTGWTTSSDFPLAGGVFQAAYSAKKDLFVSKLNTNDSGLDALWYSSYAGGTGDDVGTGITIDQAGIIYATGYTTSSDFPVAGGPLQGLNRGGRDALFLKVNTTGTAANALIYSTYLGTAGSDEATSILVDPSGIITLAGYSVSDDFPVAGDAYRPFYNGGGDAFLTQIDLSKPGLDAIAYSTYFGGSALEIPYAIKRDAAGRIYMAGYTLSRNLPLVNPHQSTNAGGADLFLSRFDLSLPAAAQLTYSTYLGGRGSDVGYDLALDPSGNAYLTGYTTSSDFPLTGNPTQTKFGGATDVFLARLDPSAPAGQSLIFSSYAGGAGFDVAYQVAANATGQVYFAGASRAGQYTTTANAYKQEPIAFNDMIVSVIDNTRSTPGTSSLPRAREAERQTIDPIEISIPFGGARVELPSGYSIAGVTTLDGVEWLSLSSRGEIVVDPAELALGVHTGVIVVSDGSTVPVTVNITAP